MEYSRKGNLDIRICYKIDFYNFQGIERNGFIIRNFRYIFLKYFVFKKNKKQKKKELES